MTGTGGSWLPATAERPAVQEWHGAKDTSSGRIRPVRKFQRNFEKTDAREETSTETGMQKRNKEPRPERAAAFRK
jgi:hypothetical protein